jgi:HEAT repeat protein
MGAECRRQKPSHGSSSTARRRRDADRLLAILANDPDKDLRYEAINALREHGGAEHREAYVKALDDPDEFVRRSAAAALSRLCDPRDIDRFLAILANDPDKDLRYEAINALREHGGAEHREAYVKALDDPDQYVRESAKAALADLD